MRRESWPLPLTEEPDPRARWGHYTHAARPAFDKRDEGLRVAVFGSAWRGMHVLAHLLREEMAHPERLNVVGLATDDVSQEAANDRKPRISTGRRLWQYFDPKDREELQMFMTGLGVMNGVDCYNGDVKTVAFWETDGILDDWKPDVIVMATCGQLIPPEVIRYPRYGMYNFHPSDLAHGKYPGPDPFTEMMQAGETTTRMTCHHVNEAFDEGHVVGFSPEIPIQDAEGKYPRWNNGMSTVEALHLHTSPAAGRMAVELVREIAARRERIDHLDMESLLGEGGRIGPVGAMPRNRFCAVLEKITFGILGGPPDLRFGV